MIPATDGKLHTGLTGARGIARVPRFATGTLPATDVATLIPRTDDLNSPRPTAGNSASRITSAAADGVILTTSGTHISALDPKSTNSNTSSAGVSFGIAMEGRNGFTRFLSAAAVSSQQELLPT
jgi:hypothetical protein